ncbi:hypothetical protein [Calothrix sp. UHCC 0171]|uniref:hypothetical protein n=1 Tax=Calothrix sp. UHCC 0171 TaxID=3110245 RepID=UPI002B21329D|nr:hypothetical protein [Calothrix sp. UHCC 0171]MEA5574708.1 hypothetical protein [Calothrix sp. UHCC 0171]
MNHNNFQLQRSQLAQYVSPKILLVGLVTIITTLSQEVIAKANSNPQASQITTLTQSSQPVQQQLIGHWQTKNASNSEIMNFIFTAEKKLFMWSNSDNLAYELTYKVNSETKPMQLDIIPTDISQKVETIFEITVDGKMRLEIINSGPGKSRPTNFSSTTPSFERISSSIIPPKNIRFFDPTEKK